MKLFLPLLLACKGGPATPPPGPDEPPNILVFLLDDVGIERLSMYDVPSEHHPQTPVIDTLGVQGRVFDRAYATPLCSSTRATLLTGRLPYRHGVGDALFSQTPWELPDDEVTIAEALKATDAGWSTAAFGKWHLTTLAFEGSENHPNNQGFDHFDGHMLNILAYFGWWRTINGEHTFNESYNTAVTSLAASEWINTASEPWYAQVNFQGAHAPFHAPPDGQFYSDLPPGSSDARLYDAMVENLDISIGAILDAMPADRRERTIVIVMGDNGTPTLVAEPPVTAETVKNTLYEGGIRVPFLISGPGISPGRADTLVSVTDILPTVLDLAGASTTAELDGMSLTPVLDDPTTTLRDTLYVEAFNTTGQIPPEDLRGRAVLTSTHKLLVQFAEPPALHRIDAYPDGPDLLLSPLSPDDQTVLDELTAVLDAQEALVQAAWADGL